MNQPALLALVNNAALLLALTVVYDAFGARLSAWRGIIRGVVAGLMLGGIAAAVMRNAWQLMPGVVFDTRSVVLALAGLFFGALPAAIAVALTAGLRVWMGGAGAAVGVAVIMCSAGVGLAWRYLRRRRRYVLSLGELYFFGVAVHLVMLACMIFLPAAPRRSFFANAALPVLLIYPLATALAGWVMRGRETRLHLARGQAAAESRFRDILELVDLIAVQLDQEGRVTFCNDYLLTLTGWSREEVLGQNWFDRFLPDTVALDVRATFAETIANGSFPAHYENPVVTRTGEQRLVRWNNIVLRDPDGEIVGTASIGEDITEHQETLDRLHRLTRELEQRVAERTGKLEAANRELEAFAYSVSHDLKAPLRAIQGFADIIATRHREALPEQAQRYFDHIVTASQQMTQLIEDLLAYSRLGRTALHIGPTSLEEVVAAARQTLAARIAETGGELQVSGDLPVVTADRGLLERTLVNLMDNALTYHRPGEPPRVSVQARQDDGAVVVEVRDEGIGIDPRFQERIFDIFQRLHPEDVYPGTGIGLAIVRKCATLMGGSVGVASEPGRGSTFWVRLKGVTS